MTDNPHTETTSSSAGNLDSLAAAAQEAAREAAVFKEKFDERRSLQRFFEELISYRDKGWLLHLKALCDRELERLKQLRDEGHPCVEAVEELYRNAQQQAKRLPTAIPSDIERFAIEKKVPIDRKKSRHPRYYFGRDGFVEARVDEQKLTCTISTREGKLATIPADPSAILETVRTELRRLFERKFNGSRFLGNLRKAYLAVLKAQKDAKDGNPIPIRRIYAQMAKKAKGYKRDEFLVDLSSLVEQGPAELSGVRFDLQQTKDTEEGILLLGAAGRGMVNLLLFRKSNTNPS